MLPLPLLSPETCAKPNHDTKFIKIWKEKVWNWLLQWFFSSFPPIGLCHYDFNLFQYLQHFMKTILQNNRSHCSFSQRCYRKLCFLKNYSVRSCVVKKRDFPHIDILKHDTMFPRRNATFSLMKNV